jgi:hypothetical protein
MSITNDKIQNLKKEIRQIISEDICTTDRVEKLWDFFTQHAKQILILDGVQNLLLKELSNGIKGEIK